MAKVIRTVMADGIDFDDICSFKTENCVGIYDHEYNAFFLMQESCYEFYCCILPECSNLSELDNAVYQQSGEHIEEVYESSTYEFVLCDEDNVY